VDPVPVAPVVPTDSNRFPSSPEHAQHAHTLPIPTFSEAPLSALAPPPTFSEAPLSARAPPPAFSEAPPSGWRLHMRLGGAAISAGASACVAKRLRHDVLARPSAALTVLQAPPSGLAPAHAGGGTVRVRRSLPYPPTSSRSLRAQRTALTFATCGRRLRRGRVHARAPMRVRYPIGRVPLNAPRPDTACARHPRLGGANRFGASAQPGRLST